MLGVCIGVLGGWGWVGEKVGHIFGYLESWRQEYSGEMAQGQYSRAVVREMIRACVGCVKGAAEWVLPHTLCCKRCGLSDVSLGAG